MHCKLSLPHNVLSRPLVVKYDIDAEEGVHHELGVELPEHAVRVPVVQVEGAEDVPPAQVVDDLHERLLPVSLDILQALAALVEVLHLPLDGVVLKYKKDILNGLGWLNMVVQPCLTFSKNFISFAIVAKMLTKIVPIIKKAFRYLIFFFYVKLKVNIQ